MSDTPMTDEAQFNAALKERDDALMMLGMYRMKSDEQKQRIKQLEEQLSECNAHRVRLIDSSMAAWARIDDQEDSR